MQKKADNPENPIPARNSRNYPQKKRIKNKNGLLPKTGKNWVLWVVVPFLNNKKLI